MSSRTRRIVGGATAVLLTIGCGGALAQSCVMPNGNFGISLQVNSVCNTVSESTAEDFFNRIDTTGLRSMVNGYTSVSQALIGVRFNGLSMALSYNANSPVLNFSIPGLGITQTFAGATREISQDMLEDYLKNTGNILGRIMNYQATSTPNSPITGVGGILPAAINADFNQNFTDSATNIAGPAAQAAAASSNNSTPNLIGIALQYSSFTAADSKTKVTTLPISYTWRNDLDPRRQLTFSMPLTLVDTEGAKSFIGGLGVSYRIPVNDNWTLTPSGKISGVGSVDLATVAGLKTMSLTSTYIWDMDTYNLAMGNMISFNQTMKFKSGDYAFDPGVKSTVLRNGLMASHPVVLNGSKLSLEYSLIDTRYTGGTKPYVDNTQEVGITLGTNKNAFSARSFFRGGMTLLRGKDTKGVSFNLGYWF